MRTTIHALLLAVLLTALGSMSGAAPHPSVVLILSDDQGYGDIRSHGNKKIDTPVLDALAADGARFERFFVSPICAPTRAALLTGRYHLRTGVVEVTPDHLATMQPDEVTLAEAFKQAGYATGLFGKWHLGKWIPYHPNTQGFDDFFGFRSGAWGDYFDTPLEFNTRQVPTTGYITDVLTDRAIAFIRQHRDRPFFCYVPYNVPHSPFQVPDHYFDKYKARGLDDRTAAVYGMCENMDENIGRILDTLETLELAEDTIVLFLTDNGPNGVRFNAQMRGHKGKVDEGGVRVPLFVRWPGHIDAGIVVEPIAAHVDLFPTLVELCGIETPKTKPLDGISLAPLLLGEDADWPERRLFSVRMDESFAGRRHINGIAVRTDRWRLTRYGQDVALYDMVADPRQKHNLADQNPNIVAELSAAIDRWYADVTRETFPRVPIPIGHESEPVIDLKAPDSHLHGTISVAGKVPSDIQWIHSWTSTEDYVWWEIEVISGGEYEVLVTYCNPQPGPSLTMLAKTPDGSVRAVLPVSGAAEKATQNLDGRTESNKTPVPAQATRGIGKLRLTPGRGNLHFHLLDTPSGEFQLNGLTLKRIGP